LPFDQQIERNHIEEKNSPNQENNLSNANEASIEETVAAWQEEISQSDTRTKEEILTLTCKNLSHLDDLETRLNEHFAIEVHIARHGTADNRRRKLLLHRSELREKTSSLMQSLRKLGMSELELYEQLPFIGKCDIQLLLRNEP